MKNKHFNNCIFLILFFSTLFIMSSCSDKNEENLVYIAEELINSRPDSSLILLESIDFPEEMSTENYAKYCRLLVVAHQKNKITIKGDILIHNSVNYYKHMNNKRTEYIESLLLLGNVYEEQDSILHAEQCYLEVYDLSKQINHTELHGASALELGGLYKYSGDYNKSINWFNNAIRIFENTDNDVMKRRSMRQVGDCYVLSGNTDTALVIYNNVLSQIPSDKMNIKADVYKNMSITYKKAKCYDQSLQFIKKAINTATREEPYPIQYLILASIFEKAGQQDSSVYYNQLALHYARKQKDLSMIHTAYDALFENKYPGMYDNYVLSRSISDSIYQKQKYESVKYQKLYNIEKIKKKNKDLTIKLQRYFFLLLIIILGFILFYLYHRSNKKKKQKQYEQEVEDQNNIINSIRNSLYQRLVIYKKMVRLSISVNKSKHKTFLKEYNKILFDNDNDEEFSIDWNIIYDLCNNLFDNYIEKMKHSFPLLNDTEQKIIILQKIGFNIAEIAAILEKSIHTIYKYSSNIRKNLNIPEADSVVDFIDENIKK